MKAQPLYCASSALAAMKAPLVFLLLLLMSCAYTASAKGPVTAVGTLEITFDIGSETEMDGVLFARFIPNQEFLASFPEIAAKDVHHRHVSFEPAEAALDAAVGAAEAARLAHGHDRIIRLPVELVLKDYRPSHECDSVHYYATLVSVRSLEPYRVASQAEATHGC